MFRWKATAALAVVAALALTGCAGGGESGGESGSGGAHADRLTLISIAAPTSYDIGAGAEWGNRSEYFEAVFDTLLRQDSKGELQPNLATEWSYNDDKTVLTLTLRTDAKFTDGTPVDAKAVVASMERFRDGTSPQAGTMKGNQYAATDDHTVTITLPAPNPALLNSLSLAQGLIAAPSSFSDSDVATRPVGSGPYILDTSASVTGTTYVYKANPDYWNKDAVKYDNLTVNVIDDTTAILNAIKAGEANGAKIADNTTISEVEGSGWTIASNELDFQGLLLLDRSGTMDPALGNVKVRQAINMAFDREALLTSLQSGYGTVTEQVFPKSSVAFDATLDSTYAYDPAGAKKLLADAGYPNGLTISMPSVPAFQTSFDLIKQQLQDIGITVQYTESGTNNFISDMLAPKYPATWMALQQDPDWQLINFMIAPNATFNPFKAEDPKIDAFIKTVQFGSTDEAAQALKDLNKYLVDQAWFAPFFRVQGSFATDANTTVDFWPTNAYPSIFSFSPKN